MRTPASLIGLLLLLIMLPACGVLDTDRDGVSARTLGRMLILANNTDARIYYFAVGRETATLIDWIPHLDMDRSIDRRTTARIADTDFFRSFDEQEVLVYWWRDVGMGRTPAVSDFQQIVVTL